MIFLYNAIQSYQLEVSLIEGRMNEMKYVTEELHVRTCGNVAESDC
jgi:hypothetical protein